MNESVTWLAQFHAGDRSTLAEVYRDHAQTALRAAGRVLSGADQETVVHEVFCRLLASEPMRRGFQGGSISSWLSTVTRNQAIDFVRRHHRDVSIHELPDESPPDLSGGVPAARDSVADDAKELLARFMRDALPTKWAPMFQLRFLRQLTQRDAALQLGISRTTLAYQELRVRRLLEKFCLSDLDSSAEEAS